MGRLEKVLGLMAFSASVMLMTMCVKDEGIVDVPPVGPDSQAEKPEPPVKVRDTLYVTGVEYPDGYDWYKDREYGEVRCFVFMEKNGERIMQFPVGYKYEMASDADMHRCFDGHLYTDYSSDFETVFKKDGKEIFRFQGREMNISFYVKDENVYTLGVSRSGEPGLTFRINGKIEEFYESGILLTGFHEDSDRICFAFEEPTVGESLYNYFYYSGGELEEFANEKEVRRVLAALKSNDIVYYVAESENRDGMVTSKYLFYDGKNYFPLDINDSDELESVRILSSPSSMYLSCMISGQHFLWTPIGVKYRLDKGLFPEYSLVSGDDVYDFVSTDAFFSEMKLYRNGEQQYSYGRKCRVLSPEPAAVVKGRVYFVFSGSDWPRRPYMAVDGKVRDGGFNGYYTSVTAW